jgi:hypothetical protein
MKIAHYPVLSAFVCLLFGSSAFAQQTQQDSVSPLPQTARVLSEKEEKQELRARACGGGSAKFSAQTDKKQRPRPDAPEDKALIYVLRSTMIGYKIHSKLAVNGDWVGVNRGKTYFYFTLDPGEHFFCSESENQSYLALTVEAGKTYYLQQQVKPGVWKARTELVVMNEEEAKKKLADLNLSVFTRKD